MRETDYGQFMRSADHTCLVGCVPRTAQLQDIHAHLESPAANPGSRPWSFFIVLSHARRYDRPMDDLSRQWAERAQYDLDTADAMFNAGRYLYVLFCCQQAVEKAIKAVIVRRSDECPPRIHQLVRLAEVGRVAIDEKQVGFLRELSSYYIPTRYPEEVADIALDVKEEKARQVLSQSREFVRWLNSMSQ
jgi:HEPN domain-containing protein